MFNQEIETLTARIAELEADNARLRGACEPFRLYLNKLKDYEWPARNYPDSKILHFDDVFVTKEQAEKFIEAITSTPPAYSLQRLMAVVLAARSQYIKLMTKDYPNDDLEFGAPRLTRLSIGRDTVNSIEALTAEDIAFAERFRGLADAK